MLLEVCLKTMKAIPKPFRKTVFPKSQYYSKMILITKVTQKNLAKCEGRQTCQ